MKYIKKYEDKEDLLQLDKYLLYKANNNTYFILEFIEHVKDYSQNYIACKKLFTYNYLLDKLKKGKHQYHNIGINRIGEIVYQSDNLKEVKDVIPALKNVDKFNI